MQRELLLLKRALWHPFAHNCCAFWICSAWPAFDSSVQAEDTVVAMASILHTSAPHIGATHSHPRSRRRGSAPVRQGLNVCHAAQQEHAMHLSHNGVSSPPVDQYQVEELKAQVRLLAAQVSDLTQAQQSPAIHTYHHRKLTRADYDVLPHRIVLLRHGESQGNVNVKTYQITPDHAVSLTPRGYREARNMGRRLKEYLKDKSGKDFKVFIMTSPYCRTLQTTDCMLEAFSDEEVAGVRQAVQLREQDFGNFQDSDMAMNMRERQRFGRFYYRFPNGESGADVYDRLTIFEDHLTRDMLMGRFAGTSLALVTHGLTLRIFLMRWFHWTVDEFLEVFNPDNCAPIVLEKLKWEDVQELQYKKYAHAKHVYAITTDSLSSLKGCTMDMSSYFSRTRVTAVPRQRWMTQRYVMASRGLYGPPPEPVRGPIPEGYASYTFEECPDDPCEVPDFTNLESH